MMVVWLEVIQVVMRTGYIPNPESDFAAATFIDVPYIVKLLLNSERQWCSNQWWNIDVLRYCVLYFLLSSRRYGRLPMMQKNHGIPSVIHGTWHHLYAHARSWEAFHDSACSMTSIPWLVMDRAMAARPKFSQGCKQILGFSEKIPPETVSKNQLVRFKSKPLSSRQLKKRDKRVWKNRSLLIWLE